MTEKSKGREPNAAVFKDLRFEPFPTWLDRQIAAAKLLYDANTSPTRMKRHWDAFLLLTGVKAEYERRTR